ncbi:hypothetical protein DAEQUDRAFT_487364 [Daedalea quercina L-15889]|uniref:Uncharacterized protein n=1 Tax=Daedalea quercina L-15889 TaxID=1314783 RepID=A0A165MQV5_9APHY|nr:hypothetical protein DAEQUDRAFT_487364 [Daedalea quercina L-15889]
MTRTPLHDVQIAPARRCMQRRLSDARRRVIRKRKRLHVARPKSRREHGLHALQFSGRGSRMECLQLSGRWRTLGRDRSSCHRQGLRFGVRLRGLFLLLFMSLRTWVNKFLLVRVIVHRRFAGNGRSSGARVSVITHKYRRMEGKTEIICWTRSATGAALAPKMESVVLTISPGSPLDYAARCLAVTNWILSHSGNPQMKSPV